ncbi:hypothetical protein NMY22_g2043 [Coprinellus aureogranulatus]|nr:hypothetical protein NMY22_g2043 [Coprinellus aureogranulatus]
MSSESLASIVETADHPRIDVPAASSLTRFERDTRNASLVTSRSNRDATATTDDKSTATLGTTFNFTQAHHTTSDNSIHDHSYHHYGNTYNVTHIYNGEGGTNHALQRTYERALKSLEKRISKGAAHDSAERGPHAPRCHEGTREAVQAEIISWVDRGHQDTNPTDLLWLLGPAGTGKTSILGSIADECQKRRWLAGTFFFSAFAGQPDRYLKEYLFPTLAYHLLHLEVPGLREAILSSIDAKPWVFDKRLDQQLDILILSPLRKLGIIADKSVWPKVIVIDGIDECEPDKSKTFNTEQDRQEAKDHGHQEIVSTLMRACDDPSFPFRIVIASRPERTIERYFSSLPGGKIKQVTLDAKYDPTSDIKLYFKAMFTKIGRDYGLADDWYTQVLPAHWLDVPRDVPQNLAQESSGQFAYAATVVRYIRDGTDTPLEQLRRVLKWSKSGGSQAQTKPFASLDSLYTQILQTSSTPLLSAKWLRGLEALTNHAWEPWFIQALLESDPGEMKLRLCNLTSFVTLPCEDGEKGFTFHHKSLFDFLKDPNRSGELYVKVEPFIHGRFYQVLKNRGPQVPMPAGLFNEFCTLFSERAGMYLRDPDFNIPYDASDVDWWMSHIDLDSFLGSWEVAWSFRDVHSHHACRWYRCRQTCRVWRKAIMRNCKAKGWRVPTSFELLRERLGPKYWYAYDYLSDPNSPLRPPPSVLGRLREASAAHLTVPVK